MGAEELRDLARSIEGVRRLLAYRAIKAAALIYFGWAAGALVGYLLTLLVFRLGFTRAAAGMLIAAIWTTIGFMIHFLASARRAKLKPELLAGYGAAELPYRREPSVTMAWIALFSISSLALGVLTQLKLLPASNHVFATFTLVVVAVGNVCTYLLKRASWVPLGVAATLLASAPVTYASRWPWAVAVAAISLSYSIAGMSLLRKAEKVLEEHG